MKLRHSVGKFGSMLMIFFQNFWLTGNMIMQKVNAHSFTHSAKDKVANYRKIYFADLHKNQSESHVQAYWHTNDLDQFDADRNCQCILMIIKSQDLHNDLHVDCQIIGYGHSRLWTQQAMDIVGYGHSRLWTYQAMDILGYGHSRLQTQQAMDIVGYGRGRL